MTSPMHLDGYSVAKAIDAAVATAGNGVRVVAAAGNVLPSDVGNTILVNAGTFTLTVPEGLPTGRVTVVNAGSGKVTLAAGSDVTFVDLSAGLILDTKTTGQLVSGVADTWNVSGGAAS